MNAFDMMRKDPNSIVGKMVRYSCGGFIGQVTKVKARTVDVVCDDGTPYTHQMFSVAFDDSSCFYTVSILDQVVEP